jgi:hypothetical protein
MEPLCLSTVARELGLVPATVRHHLRSAAAAGQPIGTLFGGRWLLAKGDLPKLRRWVARAREERGFQAGNEHHLARKNPGRKPARATEN